MAFRALGWGPFNKVPEAKEFVILGLQSAVPAGVGLLAPPVRCQNFFQSWMLSPFSAIQALPYVCKHWKATKSLEMKREAAAAALSQADSRTAE